MRNEFNDGLEAQKAVLGCIMLSADESLIYAKLPAKCFRNELLRNVFMHFRQRYKSGQANDFVTAVSKFGNESKQTFTECIDIAEPRYIDAYINVVIDDYRLMLIDDMVNDILSSATLEEKSEIIKNAAKVQEQIISAQSNGIKTFMQSCVDYIECMNMEKRRGIRTGFLQLDFRIGGICKSSYTVLAGRSGHGKTDLALNIALNMAKQQVNVLYLSLEMSTNRLMDRIASNISKIDSMDIRDDKLTAEQKSLISSKLDDLCNNTKLYFDDTAAVSVDDIKAKCLKIKPQVVFIDHMGLIKGDRKKQHWERQFEISQELRQFANSTGIAIFVLAQQSSRAEKIKDKTAVMSDIKGTDGIANDADTVMFIHADESGERWRDVTLQLTKNREGNLKPLNFKWRPQYHEYIEVDYVH